MKDTHLTLAAITAALLLNPCVATQATAEEKKLSLSEAYEAKEPTPAWDFPSVEELKDESEPDPLVFLDGSKVKTKEDWERRKMEILRLAEHYIYGSVPPETLKTETPEPEVVETVPDAFDGRAVRKTLNVYIAPDGKDPDARSVLRVNMLIPAKGEGPFPAVLYIGGRMPMVKEGKSKKKVATNVTHMLDRGYAVCGFGHRDGLGVYRHYFPQHSGPWVNFGTRKAPLHGWGEMAVWAWKARRVFEALLEQPDIDGRRIIVAGGSRYASAALLTAAYEPRVALLYCWQGVPQSRISGYQGEDFKSKYTPFIQKVKAAGKLKAMPVDNHCLLATVAPRPALFSTSGYPGPYGFSRSLMHHYTHARPTYAFLGATFDEVFAFPEQRPWKTGLYGEGPLAFILQDDVGHSWQLADWTYLIDFADEHLK